MARLHDVCKMKAIKVVCEETSRMCAYICAKAFTNGVNWTHACGLIQMVNPTVFAPLVRSPDLRHKFPEGASKERGVPNSEFDDSELALLSRKRISFGSIM